MSARSRNHSSSDGCFPFENPETSWAAFRRSGGRTRASPRDAMSALPGRLSPHHCAQFLARRRRIIERRQKNLVCFGIKKKDALIEDGLFRFAARRIKHE